jgi:hypothetical protein
MEENKIEDIGAILFATRSILGNYENNIEKTFKDCIIREETNQRCDDKLALLQKLQNDSIEIITATYGKILKTNRSTIEKCILKNILQNQINITNKNSIVVDFPYPQVLAVLDIIRKFSSIPQKGDDKVNILLSKKKSLLFDDILAYFFESQDIKLIKQNIIILFKRGGQTEYYSDMKFSPAKKNPSITLTKENTNCNIITTAGHASVFGEQIFSEGQHSWKLRVEYAGDTNWICFGIYGFVNNFDITTFGDYQTDQRFINLRGGDYETNGL